MQAMITFFFGSPSRIVSLAIPRRQSNAARSQPKNYDGGFGRGFFWPGNAAFAVLGWAIHMQPSDLSLHAWLS